MVRGLVRPPEDAGCYAPNGRSWRILLRENLGPEPPSQNVELCPTVRLGQRVSQLWLAPAILCGWWDGATPPRANVALGDEGRPRTVPQCTMHTVKSGRTIEDRPQGPPGLGQAVAEWVAGSVDKSPKSSCSVYLERPPNTTISSFNPNLATHAPQTLDQELGDVTI